MWDPAQYEAYADLRARPFFELMARVRAEAPRRVVDLGCGTGRLTAALARRWPDALVEGIDSSAEMIEVAARTVASSAHRSGTPSSGGASPGIPSSGTPIPGAAPSGEDAAEGPRHAGSGRLTFRIGDLTRWAPTEPMDVIVSNAALQWIPGHTRLLPRWVDALRPGGWLAFQVPGNDDAPSHVLLRELCASPRWRDRLGTAVRNEPVRGAVGHLDVLADAGCDVDAWETTYAHVLRGDDPVLEWVKGTALRPVLAALDEPAAARFLAEYAERLREAYPPRPYGTVFPFRRIFVVARKRGDGPAVDPPDGRPSNL